MKNSGYWLLVLLLLTFSELALSSVPQGKKAREAKQHLDRARELTLSNDPRAEQEYRLAIEARGGHYPEALQELRFYFQRQLRFSEAAATLEDYIGQTPREDHTDELEELRNLQRAARLQKDINDSEKPALTDLIEFASLVARHGKLRDSVPYAERAVSLYPKSSEAHILLARSLIGTGQQERRYELLLKAIEIDPSNPKAHHQLGWYYIEMLRGQESIDEFRKALELSNEQLTDAWQGLGWALSQLGQKKEAVEAFRNYLRSGDVPKQYRIKINQQIKKLESSSRY